MVLRRSQRKISGSLPAINRPPRIQSTLIVSQNPGSRPGLVKRMEAVAEKRLCQTGVGIDQYRNHIHFRIPEIVAFIPRKPLGPHAVFPVSGSRLKNMKQIKPHALLQGLISLNHHIRLLPHGFHAGFLTVRRTLKSFFCSCI